MIRVSKLEPTYEYFQEMTITGTFSSLNIVISYGLKRYVCKYHANLQGFGSALFFRKLDPDPVPHKSEELDPNPR